MFPIDNMLLISIPLTEITTFVIGEPLGTGLRRLFSTNTVERCSFVAHFPPFTNKAIVIRRRKTLPGLGHFLKRLTLSKCLQHSFAQPIHNRRTGNPCEIMLINRIPMPIINVFDSLLACCRLIVITMCINKSDIRTFACFRTFVHSESSGRHHFAADAIECTCSQMRHRRDGCRRQQVSPHPFE